ncbi:MAG: hypothetical protein ACUVWP_06430 [bacterium]
MIRLRDIIYVILITGSLFGICDTIIIISVDKEIILNPLRLALLTLSSAFIYSILFLIIGLSFTIFASLINALRQLKRPSITISPGAFLGALLFVVYLLTIGNIVNIKILPEKFSPTSIWGNVGIIVFGLILWFIIYRIVLYYTSAIKTPRVFFYRLIGVISVIGIFIVILTVGTKYLNISIFKGEERTKNNAILIIIETPDRIESENIISLLEEKLGPEELIIFRSTLPITTKKTDILLSTLRSVPITEKVLEEEFKDDISEPPSISKYIEERGFTTTAFISTENLIGNPYISDSFSIYDDIFTLKGGVKRLTLFQNLEKIGFLRLEDDKNRDIELTFKNFHNWMKYQAKSPFFSMVHINILNEVEDPQLIVDEIIRSQSIMIEKGLEETTLTIIYFIQDRDIIEKNVIKPHDVMFPTVLISSRPKKFNNYNDVLSNLDIAPTIIDFLGIEIPNDMFGFSILPFLSGFIPPRPIYLNGEVLNITAFKDRCLINSEDKNYQFVLDETGRWIYIEEKIEIVREAKSATEEIKRTE